MVGVGSLAAVEGEVEAETSENSPCVLKDSRNVFGKELHAGSRNQPLKLASDGDKPGYCRYLLRGFCVGFISALALVLMGLGVACVVRTSGLLDGKVNTFLPQPPATQSQKDNGFDSLAQQISTTSFRSQTQDTEALAVATPAPPVAARPAGAAAKPAGAAKFAVVRPFWDRDLYYLLHFTPEDADCSSPGTLPVDLILLYSGLQADFEQAWAHQKVGMDPETWAARYSAAEGGSGCFRKARFEVLPVDGGGYPIAAYTAFKHMWQTDPPLWGYDAIYQMEPDVYPIRQHWLDEMLGLLQRAGSGEAWVIGAQYTTGCMVHKSGPRRPVPCPAFCKEGHINGNAVYSGNASMVTKALNTKSPLFDTSFLPRSNNMYFFTDKMIDCKPGGGGNAPWTTMPWSELKAKYLDSPTVMVHVKNSKTYFDGDGS